MNKFMGILCLFFGPIVLVVGLATENAIGWIATGIAMILFGVCALIVAKFTK